MASRSHRWSWLPAAAAKRSRQLSALSAAPTTPTRRPRPSAAALPRSAPRQDELGTQLTAARADMARHRAGEAAERISELRAAAAVARAESAGVRVELAAAERGLLCRARAP
ncbi:hypothetical protein [Nonomuraea lactucae]|uniref:hypothetical protein n=1 Tax=Nonomuraea lactucae TaxID=2249762 RepID=UPI0013B3C41B|nr:hypothetical protein [Nonomuraea lactucae]